MHAFCPIAAEMPMPLSKLTPGRIHAGLLVALSAWIVHGFLPALLAACLIAIASWPLHAWFSARLHRRLGRRATAAVFTAAITVFVLAPLAFAVLALLGEAHSLLLGIAAADRKGLVIPPWLNGLPVVGAWLAERWHSALAHPGALLTWTQRADPGALLGMAQSMGQFAARHVLIVGFTILLLSFLYLEGVSLGGELRQALKESLGTRADRYVDVAIRAIRASVNSMVLVGLFDGVAAAVAFGIAGTPHALIWAAITGALAAVPFLGYVAVCAMALQIAVQCSPAIALSCLAAGCFVLLCGDKIVRPLVAREGMRLPFVWILMGCIGGFEVLGLAGLVVGPVVLSLAQELWLQRLHDHAELRDVALAAQAPFSKPDGGRIAAGRGT
jgi:predicted PurR-regulated permease PerM